MEGKEGKAPQQGGAGSSDDGMAVLSYVLAGILLYGGLGWAGAHFLGQIWMLPVGLILGLLTSVYVVVKRYGSQSR